MKVDFLNFLKSTSNLLNHILISKKKKKVMYEIFDYVQIKAFDLNSLHYV